MQTNGSSEYQRIYVAVFCQHHQLVKQAFVEEFYENNIQNYHLFHLLGGIFVRCDNAKRLTLVLAHQCRVFLVAKE